MRWLNKERRGDQYGKRVGGDMEEISNWLTMLSYLPHDGFSVKCSMAMGELFNRLEEIRRELRVGGGNDASLLFRSEVLLSAIDFLKDSRLNGRRVKCTLM